MQVLVDTGSSVLWLTNYTCNGCQIQQRYKPFYSSSYINLNESYNQIYGQGQCSGLFGLELFSIANTPINTNLKFLLVNNEADLTFDSKTSGIMGLSNWNEYENIFQSSYNENQIESPLFGFYFTNNSMESQLFYGKWNQSVLDQTIWVETNMEKMWSLEILGMKVNDDKELFFKDHSSLLDSGTTCLLLETNIYQTLYDKYFNCQTNCSCDIEYPTLTFYFKGVSVSVPDSDYLIQHSKGKCELCIYPTNGTNVLGDPFMRQFISIFDKQNQQIGFYQATSIEELKLWYFLTMLLLSIIYIIIMISYLVMTKNL